MMGGRKMSDFKEMLAGLSAEDQAKLNEDPSEPYKTANQLQAERLKSKPWEFGPGTVIGKPNYADQREAMIGRRLRRLPKTRSAR